MQLTIFLFICLAGSDLVKCADILAVIPTPFYSHQATFRPLWRELAKRGHRITLITTDLMENNANITQIDYSGTYHHLDKKNFGNLLKDGYNVYNVVKKFWNVFDEFMVYQFTHPGLVELVKKKDKFDLMFVELIMPGWPLLSVKFKCPFIGLSTMDGHPQMHAAVGNAIHPAVYPYADLNIGDNPSFGERIKSILFALVSEALFKNVLGGLGTQYFRNYIDKDVPHVQDVIDRVDMIFVNSNPLFFPPRPVTPSTVNLEGGLHLAAPQKLPMDLQKYLDDSKKGCIYVSFGTTVNSEYLSKEQKDVLVNVFKKMAPMRILWKFDDLNVAKGVPNVEVRNWVPQQDILRHPNVKLFITQGGLQSMEEAIDSAVPMLGMPFYGDQVNNVNKMHQKKFGLGLQPKTMNEVSLKSALEELLNNPIYKKNIDKFSAISKDRPMKGLEKAVWWTEYVLRHGTEHLRSPSADIPLYQYFFLDVIAFFSVSLYGLYLFTKYSFRLTCLSIRYLYGALRGKKEKKD